MNLEAVELLVRMTVEVAIYRSVAVSSHEMELSKVGYLFESHHHISTILIKHENRRVKLAELADATRLQD